MPARKRNPVAKMARQISRQAQVSMEQTSYKKATKRTAKRASNLGASPGRITNPEKRIIGQMAKNTRSITTPGEAQGVRKIARRKARRG